MEELEEIMELVMDKINQQLTVRVSVILETKDGEEWAVIKQNGAEQVHHDFPNAPQDFPELNMEEVIFTIDRAY